MEQYFHSIYEDNRNDRSITLLLSIIEPDLLRQIFILLLIWIY